jgi:cyclophilin family peptidyl-prolyl cis-trans isomerase
MLGDGVSSDGAHLDGALRGMWDFLRRQGRNLTAAPATVAQLRRRAADPGLGEGRRLALMSLLLVAAADSAIMGAAIRAPDAQLRRIAAAGLRTAANLPGRNALIRTALADPSTMVRIEAVRAWTAHGRTTEGCEPLVAAVQDSMITVQLLAIEGLGLGCGPVRAPVELLDAIATEPLAPGRWHRPVRALQALALADTGRAAIRLSGFVVSPVWWVRMHAAAAAQRLGDRALLLRLAGDSVDNVREAALRGLVAVDPAAAERVALEQLRSRRDFQLLLTAARTLRGSSSGVAVAEAALAAFARTTGTLMETSRDTRLALLDRIEEFGTADHGRRLGVQDGGEYDPLVAGRVAEIVRRLTGDSVTPASPANRGGPPVPLPTPGELRTMRRAVIVLQGGGRLEVALRPEEAPASVARFVRMARAGWFDELTLHRMVPNFVLQGGSPGANEYAGGAEFSRDEVGGSHRRGTIGISTRGRDTGDGQIFINLVDNLHLDHEYTVIGAVTAGLVLLDRILEGAIIDRIEVRDD